MSRVITFSRTFPAYHPKSGQPTFFVEKCWKSFYENGVISTSKISELSSDLTFPGRLFVDEVKPFLKNFEPKNHTIRAGNRWKVGDKFSPRVWGDNINKKSGRKGAYHSDQIIIAPDIQIKKVWHFQMMKSGEILIDGKQLWDPNINLVDIVAKNDGLTKDDFLSWFKYPSYFIGQIICWNENINY